MRKSSTHEPTHGYFYLARNIDMCKMRLNSHIGPVRTQSTNTQNMNNYKRKSSHRRTQKNVVVEMLENTGISRMVRSTSPWTSIWIFVVYTR